MITARLTDGLKATFAYTFSITLYFREYNNGMYASVDSSDTDIISCDSLFVVRCTGEETERR